MNAYRRNILSVLQGLLAKCSAVSDTLDFGCGDGWFASQVAQQLGGNLVALDVKLRPNSLWAPQIYEAGESLPFPNRSFDLAYAIDVLHHCDSPLRYLDELARVSKRYLLIKDHTCDTRWGELALAILDELGNRRFGIPSPGNYQHGDEWSQHLTKQGWVLKKMVHPLQCHTGVLGRMTNSLQYMALYEREEEAKLQSLWAM